MFFKVISVGFLFVLLMTSFFSQATKEKCSNAFNSNNSNTGVKMKDETKQDETKQDEVNNEAEKQNLALDHPEVLRNYFDHTLLKSDASYQDIIKLVEEAIAYKLRAVCVNSCRVHDVAVYLRSKAEKDPSVYKPLIVATIGFPLGASSTAAKVHEAQRASITSGAQEVDMVINIGHVKDNKLNELKQEIQAIVEAAVIPVKVIIETDLLTKAEIKEVSKIAAEAGAHFLKTSTGFVPNGKGAVPADIDLMKQGIKNANLKAGQKVEIKASGGIKTLEQTINFIKQGVTRLGSSSSITIMEEAMKKHKVKR